VAPLVQHDVGGRAEERDAQVFHGRGAAHAAHAAARWRVLLAEDNAVNQMVVTRMLHNMGLHFDVVDNGKKAVEACAANDYDVVLMVRALTPPA